MQKGFAKVKILFLAGAFSIGTFASTGIAQAQNNAALMQKIPMDKTVTKGVLPNGLTYYIKYNKYPERRAELRLAMNCGSMQEEESQKGLAHFLEHMMFNGTKNFEKNDIVKYLESIGLTFGGDLNAYTSFDEIVYKLQVPTDKEKDLKKAFQVLEDWAHNVLLKEKDIDDERGVIMEEWRGGRGAGERIQDKFFPVELYGSRYKDRLPIGDTAVIKHFKYDEIRRFYKDWFRPDLMAVVAVGDFDVKKVEELIKKNFSGIEMVKNPRQREIYDVPMHKERLAKVATDKELTTTSITLMYKKPADLSKTGTYLEEKEGLIAGLASSMLSARFSELSKKPTCPFYSASAGEDNVVRKLDAFYVQTRAKEYSMMRSYELMVTELFRAIQNGFTETELQRAKEQYYSGYENAYIEREYAESGPLAVGLAANFTKNSSFAGIETEFSLFKNNVKNIKIADVNDYIKNVTLNTSFVVTLSAPEKENLKIPTEEELLSAYDKIAASKMEAYKDITNDKPLFSREVKPGTVVSETKNEKMESIEWKLSNGVKVIVKPTTFKNDEIQFNASSPGGVSLASNEDMHSASLATTFAELSGISEFTSTILDKKLAGKNMSVNPYISDLNEGFSGYSNNKELETVFQLINLYMTEPRFEKDAYTTLINEYREQLKNKDMNPNAIYRDSLVLNLYNRHPRMLPINEKDLDNISLEKAEAFYKDRFADASDFTFVFVGSIKLEKFKPLVEKYLGSLPSINRKETWKDNGVRVEKGAKSVLVKKGIEKKSSVMLDYVNDFNFDDYAERMKLQALINVFNRKLLQKIREEKGGTYGIGASLDIDKYPVGQVQVNVGFGCDPDREKELEEGVKDVVDNLQSDEIDDFDLQTIKNQEKNGYDKAQRKNGTWLSVLSSAITYNTDPTNYLNRMKFFESITTKDIKAMAKKYLKKEGYFKGVLYPEKIEKSDKKNP